VKRFIAFLVLLGLLAAGGLAGFRHVTRATGPLTQPVLVFIPSGTGTDKITELLEERTVIDRPLAFLLAAKIGNLSQSLKAGEYEFLPGMNIRAVVSLLQSGKVYQHRITVPEGLTSFEIVGLLKAETTLTGDIAQTPQDGTLLPETYQFSRNDTRQSVIDRMQGAMTAAMTELWSKRALDVPLKSPDEAVILASIVEKETGIASERPRVAGVFINRLNRGIPLQSDPTVIYAATEGKRLFEGPITRNDLQRNSPYNTYVVRGLPPAPIANPGRASLAAALNPEKHDYIYFVADGTDGHAFAVTLKEHNANVAKWRSLEKQN